MYIYKKCNCINTKYYKSKDNRNMSLNFALPHIKAVCPRPVIEFK